MYENQASQACTPPISAGPALKSVEVPPVFRTLDELRRAQDVMRDRLEVLVNRLEPFLAPPAPEKDAGCDANSSGSPFEELLRGRVYSADAATVRIEELLRRLAI